MYFLPLFSPPVAPRANPPATLTPGAPDEGKGLCAGVANEEKGFCAGPAGCPPNANGCPPADKAPD